MGAQRPRSPYENPLPRREYKLVSGFGPQVKSTMQSFPSPSFTKGSRDVEGEKVRCRGTFRPILLELTRERPVLVIFEDVHWIDPTTFELLESTENACWREIFLMHLSQDCNDVDLVRRRFRDLPGQGKRFSTYVIDPATAQPVGV